LKLDPISAYLRVKIVVMCCIFWNFIKKYIFLQFHAKKDVYDTFLFLKVLVLW